MWEALATRSWTCSSAQAAERRMSSLKGFEDVHMKAKARIWPCLSSLCRGGRVVSRDETPYHRALSLNVATCGPLPSGACLCTPTPRTTNCLSQERGPSGVRAASVQRQTWE